MGGLVIEIPYVKVGSLASLTFLIAVTLQTQ